MSRSALQFCVDRCGILGRGAGQSGMEARKYVVGGGVVERGSSLCKRQRNQQHPSCAGAGWCHGRGAHGGAGEPWPPNQERAPPPSHGCLQLWNRRSIRPHPCLASRMLLSESLGEKPPGLGPQGVRCAPGTLASALVHARGTPRRCSLARPSRDVTPSPLASCSPAKPLSAPQGTSLLSLGSFPGAHLADRSRSPSRSPAPPLLVSAPPPLSARPHVCSVAASGGAVSIERPALSAAPAKTRENVAVKVDKVHFIS